MIIAVVDKISDQTLPSHEEASQQTISRSFHRWWYTIRPWAYQLSNDANDSEMGQPTEPTP